VVVTGGGLRVRFNQAVDVRALTAPGSTDAHIVVLRDNRPVKGRIVVDTDGQGFAFIVDGLLPEGAYTVRLPSAGTAKPNGEALDGDYDGKAGGDFRGHFNVAAPAQRLSLDDGPSFERLAAPGAGGIITLDGGNDWVAQRWTVQHDAGLGGGLDAVWTSLTGGVGGLVTLAAMPLAVNTRLARRALAAGARRPADDDMDVDAAPIRIAAPAEPGAEPTATRRAPGWVARWLGSRRDEHNDWRIRL
jgi:hypothetical protein